MNVATLKPQVYPRRGPCPECGSGYGFPHVFQDKFWRTWDVMWTCLGPEAHHFSETIRL